jgi:phage terminase small subunit
MALTDKHIRFIDEYMIDMNGAAAYLRAGYKCNEATARANASRLLTNANISAEIAKRQQKLQQDTGISVQWVLNNFKTVAERCMQAEPIRCKESGEILEYKFDSSGANKALEAIGKHLGMFTDKIEHSGKVTLSYEDQLAELDDE